MAVGLNLNALSGSGYKLETEHAMDQRVIKRYSHSNLHAPDAVARGVYAINGLVRDNPQLLLITTTNLTNMVTTCPYLIINGNAICFSNKEKAPEGLDPLCVDHFFSEAIIEEPVECSQKHTFEKRYIEQWVNSKGNHCPYEAIGNHRVGQITTNIYLAKRIRSLVASYQSQNSLGKRINNFAEENKQQLVKVNNLMPALSQFSISYSIAPSTQPIAQLFYQLTDPKYAFQNVGLTLDQKMQVLKKIAHEIPLENLRDVVKRIPQPLLDEVLNHAGFDPVKFNRLKEKLLILSNNQPTDARKPNKSLPKIFESLETAASYFYPDHNPTDMYEASQMLTMTGMALAGLFFVTTACPWAGLGLVTAVAGYAIYKKVNPKLPNEIPPSKNLTDYAIQEAPLIGRDEVIEQVFQSWTATGRSVRQHPLLVGPAGAGKTAIMQEIARRIALFPETLNIPNSLKNGFVYSCSAAELLPDNQFQGSDKFSRFFNRVREYQDQVIVGIDEVHSFMNDTNKDRFGELIKSILDTSNKGIPYMMFATTDKEFDQYIKVSDALTRRFYVIRVRLLDRENTIAALHQQVITQFPGLMYDPAILPYVYDQCQPLTEKYTHFKQPEISKKVLSRAIAIIQSELDNCSSVSKQIEAKKAQKAQIATTFRFDTDDDEEAVSKSKQVDFDIEMLTKKMSEEKEKFKHYKGLVSKIVASMQAVFQLIRKSTPLSVEDENLLKFMCKISIPALFLSKCELEKQLQVRTLNKEIIDSVIQELDANQG